MIDVETIARKWANVYELALPADLEGGYDAANNRRHHDNRRNDLPAQRDGKRLEIRQRRPEQRMERQSRC
ncbi:hypothetical protein [Bifidobacterium longum]|uniref:hypothetical protein n=1 Tax=Bifidobacterium longum TaxID=216816 RepID=UPI0010D1820E|nr:hypothetical protein [Bifidobacterium longum]TCE08812.1 hypothetical protein MCC10022_0880 [Bifidobacterium longum subsp. longum]